jgi:phage terminase large subunit GpA-like protein
MPPIKTTFDQVPADIMDMIRRDGFVSAALSRGERKVMRRKKQVRPSDWVAKNIMVPADSPTGKRYWDPAITPYWVGPMDAAFYPSVQEISVCAVPQSGKSQFINNCLGYAMDRAPGNVILCMPDEMLSREYLNDRLIPMIDDSPRLATYKTGYVDDMTASKIKLRHMKIYPAWANSASRQASKPAPYGVADEENKYPATASKQELASIDLLRMRARNFAHMRKLFRASSPTVEGVGISIALDESEVVFDYWVTCPVCGSVQRMVFDQAHFQWDGGGSARPDDIIKAKSARYVCGQCSARWDDNLRNHAVKDGQWYERVEGGGDGEEKKPARGLELFEYLDRNNPIKIAFHVPAWLPPFVSLSECAAAFVKGLSDTKDFKAFCNNIEGKPWKIIKKQREETRILSLRDDRPRGMVPGGGVVSAMLATADTQDYGFWYEIRAWGFYGPEQSKESWCVREGYVTSLAELEKVFFEDEYYDTDGRRYWVARALIDAKGHRTAEVYRFCVKKRGRIFPTFGQQTLFSGGLPFSLAGGKKGLEFYPGGIEKIPGGLVGYNFNTNYYKDELSRMLDIQPGDPSCWWYHKDFPSDYARHMTAEVINEKGLWDNPHQKDNHLWDCAVLHLLAWDIFGVQYAKRTTDKINQINPPTAPAKEPNNWFKLA